MRAKPYAFLRVSRRGDGVRCTFRKKSVFIPRESVSKEQLPQA